MSYKSLPYLSSISEKNLAIYYLGASIYYVRKIFGILDPLPPLIRISRNLSVLPFAILGSFLTPLPSPSMRT